MAVGGARPVAHPGRLARDRRARDLERGNAPQGRAPGGRRPDRGRASGPPAPEGRAGGPPARGDSRGRGPAGGEQGRRHGRASGPGAPDRHPRERTPHHVDDLSGIGGELRPGIVHRLDQDTSGLLVVAKHDQAHRVLSEALRKRGRSGASTGPPPGGTWRTRPFASRPPSGGTRPTGSAWRWSPKGATP
jgi:hypothetical protein